MPRFKATIRYNGTAYHGFQMQPDRISIQQVLQTTLERILREPIIVNPSGRTDAGVHALAQVIHFDANGTPALQRLRENDFLYRINCLLPDDISILELYEIDDTFLARGSASHKTYAYWFLQTPYHHPFFTNLAWQVPMSLDQRRMQAAAECLIGKHDFSAFCAADSVARSKTRHLQSILFVKTPPAPFFTIAGDDWLCLEFTGDGFLKQMVRNIVGTLYEIGRGKWPPDKMHEILNSKDRTQAAFTAPACGLYLKDVHYDAKFCTPKARSLPHSE